MSIVLPNVCAAVVASEEIVSVSDFSRDTALPVVFASTQDFIPYRRMAVSSFGLFEDTVEKFCIHW